MHARTHTRALIHARKYWKRKN